MLNEGLGFDEVRWATMRQTSYDALPSFEGMPDKRKLVAGTTLLRLIPLANGRYFEAVWWMPQYVFDELNADANQSSHGSGPLLRNYVVEYLALPSSNQLCFVEITLTDSVWAWVGKTAPFRGRPGGVEQVFLPNLAERGDPRFSRHARVVHTYWLKF